MRWAAAGDAGGDSGEKEEEENFWNDGERSRRVKEEDDVPAEDSRPSQGTEPAPPGSFSSDTSSPNSGDDSTYSSSISSDSLLNGCLPAREGKAAPSASIGCGSPLSCLCCGSEGDLDSQMECYGLKAIYSAEAACQCPVYYSIPSVKDRPQCSCSRNMQFRY